MRRLLRPKDDIHTVSYLFFTGTTLLIKDEMERPYVGCRQVVWADFGDA